MDWSDDIVQIYPHLSIVSLPRYQIKWAYLSHLLIEKFWTAINELVKYTTGRKDSMEVEFCSFAIQGKFAKFLFCLSLYF